MNKGTWEYETANGQCRGTLDNWVELPGDYAPTYTFTRTHLQVRGEWKEVEPRTDVVSGTRVGGKL